jgi:hypothetical protein
MDTNLNHHAERKHVGAIVRVHVPLLASYDLVTDLLTEQEQEGAPAAASGRRRCIHQPCGRRECSS